MYTAAKIPQEEIGKLVIDVHSIESGRFTKIEIIPIPIDSHWYLEVKLIPMNDIGKELLKASMFSGYLCQRGWDKVFTCTES